MLELKNLSYAFKESGVRAVDSVSLNLERGKIHAILGENGAGKSTLSKLCTGYLSADSGEILLDSKAVNFSNVGEAISSGFVLVEQNPKLADELKVWENLIIGENTKLNIQKYKLLKPKEIILDLEKRLAKLNIELALNSQASKLDFSSIYWTVIAEALLKEPDFIFFDEASAQFSPQEVENFYSILRAYADKGACVIIITHKLQEVLKYADKAHIFSLGKVLESKDINQSSSEEDLIKAMFTHRNLHELKKEKVDFLNSLEKEYTNKSENLQEAKNPIFKISNLSIYHSNKRKLSDLNLSAKSGEITGILGIKNQGLEVLEDILVGLVKAPKGEILFNGKALKKLSRKDWGYIPSKRIQRGIAPNQNILVNIVSRIRYFLYENIFYSKKNLESWHNKSQLDLEKPLNEKVLALSGGMLQKLIFNRELDNPNPKLIICSEPYFGLDQKVQFELFKRLKTLAKNGCTIIMLSSDADAVIATCDSIFVLYAGRLSEHFEKNNFDRMKILSAMLKKKGAKNEKN